MPRMRYAIEQRLRFIDFIADNFGKINRKHLEDFFGISTPQATKDFKEYMKIAPDNIRYSITEKAYKRNPEFERVWA
jgi:hypothetical protein